jgi:hypothetical protein
MLPKTLAWTLAALMLAIPAVALAAAAASDAACLPDPRSLFCPTCPALLKCFTVQEWVSFFLFGVI